MLIILNANNQATQLIEQAEDIEILLNSKIFSNRILKFKENPNKLNKSLLVSLIITIYIYIYIFYFLY
jgi:hypothetical protein